MTRLVWWLPRRLVYWCSIRLMAHATSAYPDRTPDQITLLDALKAWR